MSAAIEADGVRKQYASVVAVADLSAEFPPEQLAREFLPGPLEAVVQGGKTWALPWYVDVGLLYWRTDWVKEPPRTYQALKRIPDDQPTMTFMAHVGSTGRLELAIVDENASAMLGVKVGAPVRVEIAPRSLRKVVTVPRDAVIQRQGASYVMRVRADNTAERVAVNIGPGHANHVQIDGTLRAGDRVIIRGAELLEPGQAVTVRLL